MNFITYEIKGWNRFVSGLIARETTDWIELVYVPQDYMLDGIKFIQKKFIKYSFYEQDEAFRGKVIQSTKDVGSGTSFSLSNRLFQELVSQEAVMIELGNDEICYIGKIIKVNRQSLVVRCLSANAEWTYTKNIKKDSIRAISIQNDYLNTLIHYVSEKGR